AGVLGWFGRRHEPFRLLHRPHGVGPRVAPQSGNPRRRRRPTRQPERRSIMTTTTTLRALVLTTTIGLTFPAAGNAITAVPITHSCSAEGLAQFECGNPQAIPDCAVTCLGRASCMDAQCDPVIVEGPLGPTGEVVAYF